ncbi:MAG: DUF1840 domain-containing protein [Gammaproteobacteria bacterium]
MLVRFSSLKTESITMFGESAIQLIRMLGGSGNIPGAIAAEDIGPAVQALREKLATQAAPPPEVPASSDDSQAAVPFATRAVPLIDLLERAAAAQVAVIWERG